MIWLLFTERCQPLANANQTFPAAASHQKLSSSRGVPETSGPRPAGSFSISLSLHLLSFLYRLLSDKKKQKTIKIVFKFFFGESVAEMYCEAAIGSAVFLSLALLSFNKKWSAPKQMDLFCVIWSAGQL